MAKKIARKPLAVLLGLVAALCLSTQDLLMKLVSEELPIMQIVFLRSVVAFAAAAAWVAAFGGWRRQLVLRQPRLIALRIACNLVAWFCYYLSLPYLSLPVYTAIGFTVFLFSVALSGPMLREPLSAREWFAAAAGLGGVLVISAPFGAEAPVNLFAAALLLFGALMWAVSIVLTRALGTTMSPGGVMFYSNLGLLLIGLVGAPLVWQPPQEAAWLLLLLIGVLSFLGQNLLITAVQLTRVAAVTPTQYTMLLWATLYGWLAWETLPHGALYVGAAMIIGSSMLALSAKR